MYDKYNIITQMHAAKHGTVTPEMKKVAEKEQMKIEELMELVVQCSEQK